MATRLKTIRVPVNFGAIDDLANNTLTSIGTPVIYIAENTATRVVFESAVLYVAAQDISTATGATVTTFTAEVSLNAVAASSVLITGAALVNTGENWGGVFGPIDYTAYFNTNFGTAGSATSTISVLSNITTGTGVLTRGVYAYFDLTYTYDDTKLLRSQTICIPYESQLSTLTTTANTTFCTIPQLTGVGGILNGYASPVVRKRWIEIRGNANNNANTTAHGLSISFDSGTAVVLPQRISALASDTMQMYQVDASGVTTTATHAFAIWNSLDTHWANLVVNEYVTFDYTVSGTTNVLNYIEIPIEFNSPVNGTIASAAQRFNRDFILPEPATITTLNCAVELYYYTTATTTAQIKVGAQAAYRGYAQASSVVAGSFMFQHRIDSGSAAGTGITLARGNNVINVNLYRSAGAMSNTTGVIKLLYASGVASTGVDSHVHIVRPTVRPITLVATGDITTTAPGVVIPDANYWISSLGIQHQLWTSSAGMTLMVQAEVLAAEAVGDGWRELFTDQLISDAKLSYSQFIVRARDEFKRYPNDPDLDRLNVASSRGIRNTFWTNSRFGSSWLCAYHSIVSEVSGTISGSGGGTVTIYLYKQSADGTDVYFDKTTRVGNGTYKFTTYDDTTNYGVVAYESATLKGVSKRDLPAINFDISLSGGGSVTTGYAGG